MISDDIKHLDFYDMCRLLYVLILLVIDATAEPFRVYWNVPSSHCSIKYGINVTESLINGSVTMNAGEEFLGEKIVIFYEQKMGRYPYIDAKKGDINGGIPQLGNLSLHLQKAREDVMKIIPDEGFDGIGIIDWEAWRPIWEFNWKNMNIYKKRSIELVKNRHPTWSWKHIAEVAKTQWEETTKQWMLETLTLIQELRPKSKWCFYHFPDCYNNNGKSEPWQFFCSTSVRQSNDKLIWLWNQTSSICTSIYTRRDELSKYNLTQRVWWTFSRLAEASRVSQPQTPHYAYTNYLIARTNATVPEADFWRMLGQAGAFGLDGAIIWGSSNYVMTREGCEMLELYVKRVINPAAHTIISNVNNCRETICNGRGKCVWPSKVFTSWEYLTDPNITVFDPEEISCKCEQYTGRYCEIQL